MKLCRFLEAGVPWIGLYDAKQGVAPIAPCEGGFFSTKPPAQPRWRPIPERLLPPVPAPEKIICIGLNYRDHAIETGAEIPSEPIVFSKFNTALIGHGDAIKLPSIAKQVDYEAELVVVMGRTAKHVRVDQAMEHVYGYTCGHDVSARDWQTGRPGGQWLLAKTFDTFAPVGPCVVTADEIPDPANLRVQMQWNGETVQDSTTSQLIFSIPTLISPSFIHCHTQAGRHDLYRNASRSRGSEETSRLFERRRPLPCRD